MGDLVVDCFAGTGCLAKAAKSLHRHCVSIESDNCAYNACLVPLISLPEGRANRAYKGRVSSILARSESHVVAMDVSPSASSMHPPPHGMRDSRTSGGSTVSHVARPLFGGPLPAPMGMHFPSVTSHGGSGSTISHATRPFFGGPLPPPVGMPFSSVASHGGSTVSHVGRPLFGEPLPPRAGMAFPSGVNHQPGTFPRPPYQVPPHTTPLPRPRPLIAGEGNYEPTPPPHPI